MITLELSLGEANLILEALGAMPYARVYELINKIHQQALPTAADQPAVEESKP
jgi:hypothetical protein